MLLKSDPISEDLGRLFLRLSAGGTMFWFHGWPKVLKFGDRVDSFTDPFGLGSGVSLVLIILAEVLGSALVVLGLWTRLACVPLIIGMAVVVFMVKGDAAFGDKEPALLYLFAFTTLLLIGSGRYSVERISFK